jgi:hypothetical protein
MQAAPPPPKNMMRARSMTVAAAAFALLLLASSAAAGRQLKDAAGRQLLDGDLLLPIDLGTAGDFAILAGAGISTVPNSIVTGDIGVSPIAIAAVTGFDLAMDSDSSGSFGTSTQVVGGGKIYAPLLAPAKMTAAVGDFNTALVDAAGRTTTADLNLHSGLLGGKTLTAGVYHWTSGVSIDDDLTIKGSADDIFIFQIDQTLIVASAVRVTLDGALAKNIFWRVSGAVTFGTTSHGEGIILGATSITFLTLSSLNGRALAGTAVTLQEATITQPAH